MKHAFLVIAHNNWDQLSDFIAAVDSENCDFYIHVNQKVELPVSAVRKLETVAKKSKVVFTRRVAVVWGKIGILEASLVALEHAYGVGGYDYYHLLTGSDLLLKRFDDLDAFLKENQNNNTTGGKLKTNYVSAKIPNNKVASRVLHYNFFVSGWGNPNKVLRKAATASSTLLCKIQKLFGVNRLRKTGYTLYCGSPWWSISHAFAGYVLEHAEIMMRQYGKMTFAADEFAVQTLCMNSEFRESRFEGKNGLDSNLRLIDFERGNGYGSPHVWTMEDKSELEATENYFGRKFDSNVDAQIVAWVLKKIGS